MLNFSYYSKKNNTNNILIYFKIYNKTDIKTNNLFTIYLN